MKQFLIRLFNLQPQPIVDKECPSCFVYKEWISHLKVQYEGELAILRQENQVLYQNLEKANERLQGDKEAERQERQALEDTILKFTRIKAPPQQVARVMATAPNQPAHDPLNGPQRRPIVRSGSAWNKMKFNLEDEARKKTEQFKTRESADIAAGRMAPREDIRESQESTVEVD